MTPVAYTSVAEFYTGKTIFITGVTGFVGKVLLEKILHSLPIVERVYVLVREKRGNSATDRLEQLFKSPIFAGPGRISHDLLAAKVVPIHGDVSMAGLGLSDIDRSLIVDQVNIVFHCAANVRFDILVSESLKINYLGTKSVADLCHQIKKLEAFIHVSTCYLNCHLDEVEEKVYKTKVSGEQLIAMSANMSDGQLDEYAKAYFFEGRPNSYTFTKALAENYVADTCQDLPVAIVRLPVVVSPLTEPEPSFTDTIASVNFVVFTTGLGVLRTFRYDPTSILQVIPVDHVVNGLIVVGLELGTCRNLGVKIINMALGSTRKNLGGFMRIFPRALEQGLSYKRLRPVPNVTAAPGVMEYAYKKYILEFFYAFLVDVMSVVMFKKPSAVAGIRKLSVIRDGLEYFLLNSQLIKNENYRNLNNFLDPSDQDNFNTRVEDVTRIFNDKEASLSFITACVESFMKYKYNETVTQENLADRKKFTKRLELKETVMFIVSHAILCGIVYLFYYAICLAIN